MLRPGMIVMTARGPVELRGRNGCHRWMWWGWPIKNGKSQRQHMWVGTAAQVQAIKVEQGYQMMFPEMLQERE